eukprot:TRINITY_DN14029_c0_g1_i3.p1 TRINITY_DN14029_c0_g1~~TRINITY_DN14029_c0_g1_i3.p1  ORF type:complete len:101 (-),score=31.25 TRINITY_DN14029_c0_g1_i3:75-377(-)
MSKDWSNGTFDCCSDMGTCCMATWCGCCLVYSTAEELGESGVLYFLLGCITPCIPVMMLRTKAREMHNIDGSTSNDAIMACCCNCCALVQTSNEIKQNKQ